MKLVIIESPYAGDADAIAVNESYARRAMADALRRGEAPYASHLLYTQPGVLDDTVPDERSLGIAAGLAWGDRADATVVYSDLGMTIGMCEGVDRARAAGRRVIVRFMDGDTCSQCDGPMAMTDGIVEMCPNGCED